jgi:hypothetical protein
VKKSTFGEVSINSEFFDAITQETYRKVSASEAVMITSDLAGKGDNSEFEEDEPVLINE